jgi:hypothetical protein
MPTKCPVFVTPMGNSSVITISSHIDYFGACGTAVSGGFSSIALSKKRK